jgi:hypothetical protein
LTHIRDILDTTVSAILPRRRLLKTKFLISFVVLASLCATAGILNYSDTTAGGPTWNRPVQGNPPVPPLSITGTAVPYHVLSFVVDTSGSYDFLSTATVPADWDNYLFLYANGFNPLDQYNGVLIGDDDFSTTPGLSGFTAPLTAGTSYFLVTTGFENTSFGEFSNSVQGPGDFGGPQVPEPATSSLIAAGLAFALFRLRRA